MYRYNIGVIGGSKTNDHYCSVAYKIGELLSEKNCIIVCGGEGGVMECVSKGAFDHNGIVIGILPGFDKNDGNKYLTIKLPTGIGYIRNFLIIRASDVIIAIDGYSGTTSEAAFAITEGKTVVSIGDMEIKNKDSDGKFIKAATPEDAVHIAMEEVKKIYE